ncbi:hypothetical protein Droror1_Dr00022817 [Drosera rotundifolia]
MSSLTLEAHTHRKNAEIYTGHDLCSQKSIQLLSEFHLPNGLLPLSDIVEAGINRTTGFVWVKQKKPTTHRFETIGKTVRYDTEVTAVIEEKRMRKLSGVKSKEVGLIWVKIGEISVERDGMVSFGTGVGVSRSFPAEAFMVRDGGGDDGK